MNIHKEKGYTPYGIENVSGIMFSSGISVVLTVVYRWKSVVIFGGFTAVIR